MAETVYKGPAISLGSLMGNVIQQGGTQVGAVEPTDGPGVEYQANAFPDPRFGPFNKDSLTPGRLPAWLNSPYVVMADGVPQATGTAAIAANQQPNANPFTFTLVTTAPGGSAGVCSTAMCSLIPLGGQTGQSFPASGTAQSVLGIDMGFTTGNTTAASGAVSSIPDTSLLYVGQWISIGGAGKSDNTLSLITQVTAITSATAITISPVALGTLSGAPISTANRYFSTVGSFPFTQGTSAASPTGVQPYSLAGVAAIFNPLEGITRNVTVTAAAGALGGVVTIKGFDIYGMPMTENITSAASTTVAGKKAFKYILSATTTIGADAHNYSIGLGNLSGFNIRSDRYEYTNLFYKGSFLTTSNGYLGAVTSAASATTGDVRGTIDVSNASGFNQAFNGNASTGRVTWMMSVPLFNLINANPTNVNSLLGVTQF